jgi:hypothetical protein
VSGGVEVTLAGRIEQLERRLDRLEQALGGIVVLEDHLEPSGEALLTGAVSDVEQWCERITDRLDELTGPAATR